MSLVAMPATPVAANIDWTINQPSQVNRSEFTARRQVAILAGAPRWKAKVTLPPIVREANVLAWRAFVADLDGQANSFRLIACENDQITGVAPKVNGADQYGHTLITDGWGGAGLKLKRGQLLTINDQLLMLMANVVADDSGAAAVQFKPFIRLVPGDNAPIEATRPYALMSMSDPENGWSAGVGQKYAVSFECEESLDGGA